MESAYAFMGFFCAAMTIGALLICVIFRRKPACLFFFSGNMLVWAAASFILFNRAGLL